MSRARYLQEMALAIGMALCPLPIMGQKTGPQSPGGAPGGPNPSSPGIGGIGSRNTPGTRNTGPAYPDMLGNRGIYLSGQVMLDDGTPPPEPVTIERVCGANPRAETYTDIKGRF